MAEDRIHPPVSRIRMGRRMNSQMNISLPIELHERLRTIAWEERIPLSHLCRYLLEVGLKHRGEIVETVEASTDGD